ncbi:MAG: MBG domain-containing protein [Silvibacterium sp.]
MTLKYFFGAIALLVGAAYSNCASAQANVIENEPVTIYVNGQSGSNANPGTAAQPVQTIQQGVNLAIVQNKHAVGVKILIAPGVYREAVSVASADSGAAMTMQAATAGTVFIDGANILTNWSSGSPGVYTFPWTDSIGGCPLPANWYTGMPPVVLANEMIFVNGNSMTQVMSASQLIPGTFFVNSSYEEVEVDPPSGTDMSTAQVEVAARRATLTVTGGKNLVFRGLVFQHAASCMNYDGANVYSSSNILFDTIQANWNNWGGLGVTSSTDVTVQNSIGSYNGGLGLGTFEVQDALYQNNETDYNNWRGEMAGLYDVAMGGTKIMRTHTITISGQRSYNNGAEGLHFDTDNMNATINGAALVGNLIENLQLEASQGPFTVENSSFCGGGTGINLINAGGVTVTGNSFYDNGNTVGNLVQDQNAQIFLAGNAGGRIVTNYETGVQTNVYTADTTLENNTFTAVGAGQLIFNTYLSGTDWSEFAGSLHSADNDWFDAANSMAFGLPGGKHVNSASWQSMADDTSSSWQLSSVPANACAIPAATYPDFSLSAHDAASYISSFVMSNGALAIPLQVRSFGFGTVQLSATGLPAGVSASFSPSTLVSGSSTLTLTASSAATAQTVAITVFAVSGSRVHTLTEWVAINPGKLNGLTVTAANATRTYGLPNPALTATVSGAVTGETFTATATTTATLASTVGTYPIVPSVSGTDLADYTVTKINGTLTVTQAAPVITWAAPASIASGTTLSTVLDASAKNGSTVLPGSYTYTNGTTAVTAATVLPAGTYTLHVTFTPTDTTDYATATATTALTVSGKITPVITWSPPASIVSGATLSTVLNASAKNGSTVVPGTYAYTNGTTAVTGATVLPAGTYTLQVTFTPTDTTDYATATATTALTVSSKTTPVITWPAPASITSGATLSTVLNASAKNGSTVVPGTYAYTNGTTAVTAATVLPVGSYTLKVTFTPTDATDYATATATTALTVSSKITPVITWPAPASIVSGTTLSTVLDASAKNGSTVLPGTYAYTNGTTAVTAATVLPAGTYSLHVTFTPTDTTDYATATATATLTVSGKITPVITWSPPASIVSGTTLSTVLDASAKNGSTVLPGTYAYTNGTTAVTAATVLPAGTYTLQVTFTPTDTTDYATATAATALTVSSKITPVITWSPPATVVDGATLTRILIASAKNGSTVVPGTYAYTNGTTAVTAATVLPVGSYTLHVTFTPTDTTDYATATATDALKVNPFTAVISWPAPASIAYGASLSGVLNASAMNGSKVVPGTYAYTNGTTAVTAATILSTGSYTLHVTFTPTNSIDYAKVSATTALTVTQITPLITWAAPTSIADGTTLAGVLGASAKNGSTAVPGTYAYTNGTTAVTSATVLPAGSYTLQVTFTPTDTTDYATATSSATLTVTKTAPAISWPAPTSIAYGTTLSGVLNASATNASTAVAGTYAYTNGAAAVTAATVLPAGSYTLQVTFTPTDTTDYSTATATATLKVTQITPAISWSPASVGYGTTLSGVLNASATNASTAVPGAYAYTNGAAAVTAATVLPAGTYTLQVTFTPTDTTDYSTATATTALTVTQIVPVITWPAPAAIADGTALSSVQLNATSSVPGAFVYGPAAGTVLPVGQATLQVTFTPTDTTDYAIATSTVQLVVNSAVAPDTAANFTVTVNPTLTIAGGASGSAILNIIPIGGFNNSLQLSCSGLPANSTCTFSPAAVTPNGTTVNVGLTIATDVQTSSLAMPSTSPWTTLTILRGGSGFGGLLALCFLPRRKTRAGWRTFLQTIVVVAALGVGMSALGCGSPLSGSEAGVSAGAQLGANASSGTPAGSSTVTVTASTGTPGGTSHSANLTLTVTD